MNRKPIFDAIRAERETAFSTAEVDIVDAALDKLGFPRQEDAEPAPPLEQSWIAVARSLIGTREIPGPKHSSFIANGWARLGAGWFNDDETPWCGFFVAHCLDAASIPIPGKGAWARAKAWLDWGKPCPAVKDAVVIFGRDGGGHVGFLVGQDKANFYVLGGNQSNMVSITPIAKSRALGFRWPTGKSLVSTTLPQMAGGTVSRDEA
jgi:uncharacterized protein (TIGR02594 family)